VNATQPRTGDAAPRTGAPRVRRAWQRVDGVLLLDKPRGPSSNDALQRARRAFSAAKGGHGGTLDPMATGLLPIAFGEATKFLHDLLDADKTYEATMCLGVATDSGDAEGVVIAERAASCDDAAIAAACAAFAGEIAQVPPMHSALKRDGRPLYAYAREGITLEREARTVTVHEIALIGVDRADPARPLATFGARVSKGTYIRTLAQDIGERLGCGAHLVALRRTRVGALDIAQAVDLDALEAAEPSDRAARLRPLDTLVAGQPRGYVPHYPFGTRQEGYAKNHGLPFETTQGGKETMRERDVTVALLGVVGQCCCYGSVRDQGGHTLFADVSIDLVIDVRVPARGGCRKHGNSWSRVRCRMGTGCWSCPLRSGRGMVM
jgi:tRNA pseudouridine55 synthase